MSALIIGRTAAFGALLAAFAVGCVVQESSSSGGGYSGTGSSGGGSDDGGGTASSKPMLVDVDPDRTLTAHPGDGVGVFTEYRSGGEWHIWWTCDTNKTSLPCTFQVTVTAASGAITNASSEQFESNDQLVQLSDRAIEALTQTATGVDGIVFDADPGATIQLDAQMNGQDSGSFLFFVQNGQVNGGYQGSLTDPLMFEPASK